MQQDVVHLCQMQFDVTMFDVNVFDGEMFDKCVVCYTAATSSSS